MLIRKPVKLEKPEQNRQNPSLEYRQKPLLFRPGLSESGGDGTTRPAPVSELLPGTQLVNRLQDLKYRVRTIGGPAELAESALNLKPMVLMIDLAAPTQ